MAKGILIAAMNFSDVAEDEFHDWYDTEHVPERLAVPGFLNAERWIGVHNPKDSVALYDLDTVGVLHSPAYLEVSKIMSNIWWDNIMTGMEHAKLAMMQLAGGPQMTEGASAFMEKRKPNFRQFRK